MKYVSIDVHFSPNNGKRFVIAFPNDLIHEDVAKAMIQVAVRQQWPKAVATVHAAGEIDVMAHETFGKSTTLQVLADPEDAAKFNTSDYGGNYL